MHAHAYRLMADLEAEHWWYRARRVAVAALIARLELPEPARARLLDVGAGSGGNLELLAAHGATWGVEPSPDAAALAPPSWRGRVVRARAESLPFVAGAFDLVAALDVLEHVHNDLAALDEIHRLLRPGGHVVLHVPAYAWLWGHEDVLSHHRRRYRAIEIRRLLVAAGFELVHVGHVNAALLPLIAAAKVGKRLLLPLPGATADGGGGLPVALHSDVERLPPWPLNGLLAAIATADAAVAAQSELPFGASILAAARRG